jgi:aryl-alcohol dehydrogenase-like predicted oxidoreductase
MTLPSRPAAPGSATPEGTRRYAQRFAGRAAQGHFREQQGWTMSSIGLGTYLGKTDTQTDASYTEAVVAAVRSGVNVIDSAINYRFQRSERSIGAALKKLAEAGYERDELVICTKGGYLTPDGEMPADPADYFRREYFHQGILAPEDVAAGHSLAPRFLEDQLNRSLRNLGIRCIDVYYLHNPETQLMAELRATFPKRVRAAFELLESGVAAGKIRSYGMATWNAFRQPESAPDAISLAEMVELAREVAGEAHHFRFVQLPYNLAMPEALAAPNQLLGGRRLPMVEAARQLGIALVASASPLQVQLSRNLPKRIAEVLGQESDLHRAVQFARSSPGITTALVGMSRPEHVESNLKLVGIPPAPPEQILQLFSNAE